MSDLATARCEQLNKDLEIHYWTGPHPGDPCECGKTHRLAAEERAAAKRANFADWLARQPGARREP